ncbi:MAG TPA: aminotransferase class I/II-fold pyridoxal phosphate-dependent enzyme [Spirochaetales bacterium]|nr:aminotransferase class I/II-fold pyridoxal phosphate-dependent enzyme [Spirochaetales bacterium]
MALKLSDLGQAVLDTEYAVRGPIVARANELEKAGKRIIYCNIGNPQALGQKPITYVRQVLALVEYPELLDKAEGIFPPDTVEIARTILKESKFGVGAYSDSKGLLFVRKAIANFIQNRDSYGGVTVEADAEHIYLTDGASKGVQTALMMLLNTPNDGIMIPVPQYPLYSATITLYGGKQIGYFLDEKSGWALSQSMLESSLAEARAKGVQAKAICIINPGNPTGAVLTRDNIAMVIDFAKRHNLTILADEVYQENIYRPEDKFVSFARVMTELGEKEVSLFSFHSCSKGFLGECGQRGGYMEVRNVPAEVVAQITKLMSVSLCSNLVGQLVTYLMVKPPKPGDPSYEAYEAEKQGILSELKKRAVLLSEGLNKIPGISCQPIAGAMYAFPSITLPEGRTDEEYCMALLESEGICLVSGSGFGQMAGTAHFRTTILPPTDQIEEVVRRIAHFQSMWR